MIETDWTRNLIICPCNLQILHISICSLTMPDLWVLNPTKSAFKKSGLPRLWNQSDVTFDEWWGWHCKVWSCIIRPSQRARGGVSAMLIRLHNHRVRRNCLHISTYYTKCSFSVSRLLVMNVVGWVDHLCNRFIRYYIQGVGMFP